MLKPLRDDTAAKDKFAVLDESRKGSENRLHDSTFIQEYGKIETARSERYGFPFSIVIIHIDSFKAGAALSKKDLLNFFKIFVTTTLKVVRNCDITGMLEDKRLIVILPQTDYFGSLITIKKLYNALQPITVTGEPYANLIFSHATYPKDANGWGEFLNVAVKKIAEMKESPWEKRALKNKLLWHVIDEVTAASFDNAQYASFEMGEDLELKNSFLEKINETIIQEIMRTPEKRGILYMAGSVSAADSPVKKLINSMGKTATKIFVVGEVSGTSGGDKEPKNALKNAVTIALNDPRLKSVYFTFFMNEDSAYSIICKEGWNNTFSCFHTSDACFTEGVISKLQRDYSLQEQL